MPPARYKIAIRVTHPTMKPKDIAVRLGLVASRHWEAGFKRTTSSGRLLSGRETHTYCVFELKIPKGMKSDLVSALNDWTEKLSASRSFLKSFRSTGGTIEYFIGVFLQRRNAGLMFPTRLLKKWTELGLDLSLDIYEIQKD